MSAYDEKAEEFRKLLERLKSVEARFQAEKPLTDQQRAEMEAADWAREAMRIGLPDRLVPAKFGSSADTHALRATRGFMSEAFKAGGCLTLLGDSGLGKSWAAACALRSLQGQRINRRYLYFPALCNDLLGQDGRSAALQDAIATRFCVFDDWGAEYKKLGGWLESMLDQIIWHREGHFLPTIITTNMTPEDFRAGVSERIRSRINAPWGRVVKVGGPSMRQP